MGAGEAPASEVGDANGERGKAARYFSRFTRMLR